MLYKTIILELLQERPGLYEQLRCSKRLLPAMDAYAIDLKACHEQWKADLSRTRPGSAHGRQQARLASATAPPRGAMASPNTVMRSDPARSGRWARKLRRSLATGAGSAGAVRETIRKL